MFREKIIDLLQEATGLAGEEINKLIEVPKDPKLGDYAFPCFNLSKTMKKAPTVIAAELAGKIHSQAHIKTAAAGPYLNFFVDKSYLGDLTVKKIIEDGSLYGSAGQKHEKILIEYPAPNTNKPLHLGHVRNMLLGASLCSILAFSGYKVIPVNLVNDRGIHICKSMLAYQKWGDNKEPDKKSDHFVGDYYVLFSKKLEENPGLEQEAQEMLAKWEAGDHETVALWNKMRKWALDGQDETYKEFDVYHKKTYYESDLYKHGKEIIMQGLKEGLFQKDESGAIYVDLGDLGKKYLLRADGTSIYITQDIYLAKVKFDDFQMDRSIHVVGSEQMHHFKVLFRILEILGFSFAKSCHHLSYGMIYLPEGKMKSREGTVVDADDLTLEMSEIAKAEIEKRHKLSELELNRRSRVIGMGALKFFMLKYDALKDFTYNQKESISFEGETGPYVQYAHARICSIFRQAGDWEFDEKAKLHYTEESEHRLITLLAGYPQVIAEAAARYDPSFVSRYALDLSQEFSGFYNECPILKAEEDVKASRLALAHSVRIVLQSALSLLGIDSPEEM